MVNTVWGAKGPLKIATRNAKNRIAKNSTTINSSSASVDLSNNGWKNGSAKNSIL